MPSSFSCGENFNNTGCSQFIGNTSSLAFSLQLSMFSNNIKLKFGMILWIAVDLDYDLNLKFALDKHFEVGVSLIYDLILCKGDFRLQWSGSNKWWLVIWKKFMRKFKSYVSMENFRHRKFLKTSSPVRFLEMVFNHTGHTNITNSEELQILFFEPLI